MTVGPLSGEEPADRLDRVVAPWLKEEAPPDRQSIQAATLLKALQALEHRRRDDNLVVPAEGHLNVRQVAKNASLWHTLELGAADERAEQRLVKLLGAKPEVLRDLIAQGLISIDGIPAKEAAAHVCELVYRKLAVPVAPGINGTVDMAGVRAFMRIHQDAIADRMRDIMESQRHHDIEQLTADIAGHPELSFHEVWTRDLDRRPRATKTYYASLKQKLAPLLRRPIDRMGDEPNLLLAARLTQFLFSLPAGTTLESAVRDFKQKLEANGVMTALRAQGFTDFTVADAERLAKIYVFVPVWADGKKRLADVMASDVPTEMAARLKALASIPMSSVLMQRYSEIRGERGALANTILVSAEHALSDKIDLFRHLIIEDGMRGEDIKVVWKHHSADPIVIEVAQRCFGVEGPIASPTPSLTADECLDDCVKLALMDAMDASQGGRVVNAHLQGVRAWSDVARLSREHPHVPLNICVHTTSDARQIENMPAELLSKLAMSVMATQPAKIRYERWVFKPSFVGLTLDIDRKLEQEIGGTIRSRRFLVYGGGGRIIGRAIVEGLRSQGFSTAVVDPWLSTPEAKPKRDRLATMGVDIIDNDAQLTNELATKPLVIMNATPAEVITPAEYQKLAFDPVLVNFGTGQRGFSIAKLEEMSFHPALAGPKRREVTLDLNLERHQASYEYTIPVAEGPRKVFALGNGAVFNLGQRAPNPQIFSSFNNVLLVDALHTAKWNREHGLLGPQVPASVQVAFTDEASERPIVTFLPRDGEAPTFWPKVWPREVALPAGTTHDPVVIVDWTKSHDAVKRMSERPAS